MPSSSLLYLFIPLAVALASAVGFSIYAALRYAPIISRIFEEKPLFLPLRLPPRTDGEDVSFPTVDGLTLGGTYLKASTPERTGVLVFCHEYLSNRWSYEPYLDSLRALGYDIFTFDFRNHGASESDPRYQPLQWVSNHEVRDLKSALAYLRKRADRDPAGFGLFGVSRGGGAALVTASRQRDVWGVITDGAFPTRGTMLAYILRWAEIYVASNFLWRAMPRSFFRFIAWAGRVRSERRLHCRFPDVERAVSRIGPRPWLLIHGEKDGYIVPAIARELFAYARDPKDIWIVPKAKHNRCREKEPEAYAGRVIGFLRHYAPRREYVAPAPVPEPDHAEVEEHKVGPDLDLPIHAINIEMANAPVAG